MQPALINAASELPEKQRKRLEKSWAGTFYQEFFSRIDEEAFAILYSEKASCPNAPVNVLVGLEALKAGMRWSDEEFQQAVLVRCSLMIQSEDAMLTDHQSLKKYIYDLEVFPDFFCATFLDCDMGEKAVFVIYRDTDDRQKLRRFLARRIQLIGFNNLSYDGPLLVALCTWNARDILAELFSLSKRLVAEDNRQDEGLRALRYPRDVKWSQMDLMKIMAFDARGLSLKQTAVHLRWRRIQDLPLPYDHQVQPDEVETILDYNLNDVLITCELYKAIQPQIQLRSELSQLFEVDLSSTSDSKMANLLLEKIYAQETRTDVTRLRNLRTLRQQVRLAHCIAPDIEFQTPALRALKQELEGMVVFAERGFGYQKTIKWDSCEYEMGTGGLHSKDQPGKFRATERDIIRDADVSSYYPSIMIRNRIKPAHLSEDFTRILHKITQARLEAKRAGDKAKADGLKITVNSIFGKLGSDAFWLQDAQAMLAVTVSGQLYLLMLIEALTLAGIAVLSANTDGIICKIPRQLEGKYQGICAEWQGKTGYALEFSDYMLYVRSDVNNYITQKVDGTTKEKGRYATGLDLKKGYKYPVVPRCLYEYFVNGKPVEQTLRETQDILDFCISLKAGQDFKLEYHTVNGITELQKTNRFYISRRGGALVKRNTNTSAASGLFVGNYVQLLNDFDDQLPFSHYDVNLDFYKREALKSIEEIEPPLRQTSMFDLFSG